MNTFEKKENVKAVIPIIQFAKLGVDDLVKTLEEFLREHDIRDVRNQIEELKTPVVQKEEVTISRRDQHKSKHEFFLIHIHFQISL